MMPIAIAGFQHETNSFSPISADWAAFCRTTSWPGLTRGPKLRETLNDMNLALAGFIAEADRTGVPVAPLLWANATPSGLVTDEAFERVMALLISDLLGVDDLTAVFLDLHGAMISQSYLDGEAEILRRVRAVVGDRPIVATLDLHANVSPEMVRLADALVPCRTYPHVDLAETGRRAFHALTRLKVTGPIASLYRQPDFLIPIQAQCTDIEPARRLYARTAELERAYGLVSLSLTLGFGPSDMHNTGPAICGYGEDAAAVTSAVEHLYGELVATEGQFAQPLASAEEAVRSAIAIGRVGAPAILADLQDNPGAGGTGDTTGLLSALMASNVEDAVLAVLYDPQSAKAAHAAGEGAEIEFELGGKCGGPGSVPVITRARIERLGDGRFRGTGPMYGGASMDLGPMALLKVHNGPWLIVGSVNTHTGDQSIFRHLGVEPSQQRILALKSAVHFRADFAPMASEIFIVEAPGSNFADYRRYHYKHLRSSARLMPQQ